MMACTRQKEGRRLNAEKNSTDVSGASAGRTNPPAGTIRAFVIVVLARVSIARLLQLAAFVSAGTTTQTNSAEIKTLSRNFSDTTSYAEAGRCARRKERIWRTARGIRSLGSFHGNMLTSAFGASIAASIATAYGCEGISSGRMSTGV
jgi:hypothetical protein